MDFKLSEEQLILRQTAREFAQNEVKPLCRLLDAKPDPKDCFSSDLIKKASKLGFRTMTVPAEYGGENLDLLSIMIVMEELAAGDPGFAFTLYATNAYITFISRNCTNEQKDEFITKYVEDDTFLIALGSTEPNAGTDNTYPYDAPGGAMQTYADREGDQYVLNGVKAFITNGACAKLYIIMARMDRKAPITDTLTPFLVLPDTPGFSVGKIHNKIGMRYQLNAELIMDNARIPAQYRIGEEHKGYPIFRTFRNAVTYKNVIMLGTLRKTYEEALDYAKSRVQGGRPIIEHPTIAVKLGAMRAQIEAIRLLIYKCAWSEDNQYEFDPKLYWLTKGIMHEMAIKIAADAMEICGAMGTDKDMSMEKNLRDIYEEFHGFGLPTMALWAGRPQA